MTSGKSLSGDAGRRAGRCFVAAGAAMLIALAAIGLVCLWMASRAAHPLPYPHKTDSGDGAPLTLEQKEGSVDWGYWLEVNPDIVGWVEVPGTAISQPIVQASARDPLFYLSHDVYREWNMFGCPYVDAGCSQGLDSWNVVVSGHNISLPPAMFHDLELYHDPRFANDHSTVIIHTPAGTRRLCVIGVKTVLGEERLKRVEFESERDFRKYRHSLLDLADFRVGDEKEPAPLLTLCSCSYFENPLDERTLVFAQ